MCVTLHSKTLNSPLIVYTLPIPFATPAFDEAVYLRHLILRVPLGMTFKPHEIADEADSTHLGIYANTGELLGVLTMKPLRKGEVKMRQVAVAAHLQGKGIGSQLVAASEVWAKEAGFQSIVLHAREVAVPFYERLGYVKEGSRFLEVGIPHWRMRK